jgi:hypothetical protein
VFMILDRKGRDSDRRDPRSFRFRERQMLMVHPSAPSRRI